MFGSWKYHIRLVEVASTRYKRMHPSITKDVSIVSCTSDIRMTCLSFMKDAPINMSCTCDVRRTRLLLMKDMSIDVLTKIEARKNILVERVECVVWSLWLLMRDVMDVPEHQSVPSWRHMKHNRLFWVAPFHEPTHRLVVSSWWVVSHYFKRIVSGL